MAEYIDRRALFNRLADYWNIPHDWDGGIVQPCEDALCFIEDAPEADVVEMSELREFAEDVVYQFGYHCKCDGRLHLTTGGLSTLESAFAILGWDDPKPYPEGECEWDGCYEYASCGTPTPDGYKRLCGRHYACVQARKEAEEMDGE